MVLFQSELYPQSKFHLSITGPTKFTHSSDAQFQWSLLHAIAPSPLGLNRSKTSAYDEREMDHVLGIEGVELIGIYNRCLETFQVDITNTKRLLEGEHGKIIRQRDIIVVGESGLFAPYDVAYVQEVGVRAVLVGESLVKQNHPGKGMARLFGKDISALSS
ncbi:indole-3-glycerol phosphate synthase, chloroplastic-like [Rutidosis leptorrhynchoides]|uniref:indole-3-glycerol phosphate synthase, chloroplastic-like n=1 Tax=Rutidosis leptorrhynchoides TaxID=125765 RepID=UPI003A9974DF